MQYRERYCGFVDILGFSQLIADLRSDKTQFDSIRSVLEAVHSPPTGPEAAAETADFRATSISDAVAVSTDVSYVGLSLLFNSLEALSLDLLSEGYFVRGAIVKGPLFHDEKMVFGEALVRAYQLESTVARFPRIVVTSDISQDIVNYHHQDALSGITRLHPLELRQADDGPMYLHIFRRLLNARKHHNYELLHRYDQVVIQIARRFKNSIDNPRHFEKAQWIARYWNDAMADKGFDFQRIHGAGLG